MDDIRPKTLAYQRANFSTRLPVDWRYSASHCWIARRPDGLWRVGFTGFAVRLLGELVDHAFDVQPGATVALGQLLGWVEGFKTISDVFCLAKGRLAGGNPELLERLILINKDPYGAGWLYAVDGEPDPNCLDVEAYRALLDRTISRHAARQRPGKGCPPSTGSSSPGIG